MKGSRAFPALFAALLAAWPGAVRARDLSGLKAYPMDLARGLREEVRPEGLLTLLGAGGGASIARFGDTADFDDFRIAATLQRDPPLGRRITDVGGIGGYPVHLMAAMGLTYLAGWGADAPAAQEFGLLGFEALSLAGIQTLLLKVSVRRVRPDNTDLTAFPSGHTSASFSLAAAAASQWGWRVGLPACLLAAFVGYSRMESNNHYLSDVLFGAGVGIVSGRAAYKVRRRQAPERYAIAPFVSPGGGGVRVWF